MKNRQILVFGGTVEGRQVSDYLNERRIRHTLCVATEYGEEVLEPREYLTVHQGRMKREEMGQFILAGAYAAVVDATHPYAVEVSANVREACVETGVTYLRYLRPPVSILSGRDESSTGKIEADQSECMDSICMDADCPVIYVNSAKEAAQYLETQTGQVFLTTGSKELHVFTEILTDCRRLFARVLPSAEVVAACRALGLEGRQICAMQGPFSAEINEAMMRQVQASFLVTKDTGKSGGFPEKIEAAKKLGVKIVIIRRPEDAGYDWEELQEKLEKLIDTDGQADEQRGTDELIPINGKAQSDVIEQSEKSDIIKHGHTISCVGIGMGTYATLTQEVAGVIRSADIVFGAKRIIESVCAMFGWQADCEKPLLVTEYSGAKIAEYFQDEKVHQNLKQYQEQYQNKYLNRYLKRHQNVVILMSGDVGFYSGARGIQAAFPEEKIHFYCGISSIVYFASRIPTAWQDAKLLSAHGKQIAILNYVRRYPKIFLLVSDCEDVERICRELVQAGQNQIQVTVGTNLSYPDETIRCGTPEDFMKCDTQGLHIMMLENPCAEHIITPGIADDVFVRGKVPMTKEEVRILSVAKLHLTDDAVVYDVGAGTGSVSVEIARLCTAGTVYAIERNPEGISLIGSNSQELCVSNVIPVEGLAPGAMADLPKPTHAFIGGSAGNMKEILLSLWQKNPAVRVVINTVALESIGEVTALLNELAIEDVDIAQVSVAKSKKLGRHHMMNALNPVYIISFGGEIREDGETAYQGLNDSKEVALSEPEEK